MREDMGIVEGDSRAAAGGEPDPAICSRTSGGGGDAALGPMWAIARLPGPDGENPVDVAERLGDEIGRLAGHINAATCRMLELLWEFERIGGWELMGALSCAHWLSWRTGIAPGAAREHVRVARALPGLPRIREAFAAGRLSFSKVRAVTRVATPENEETLLEFALDGTAAQLERTVRGYRLAAGGDLERAKEQHERRELAYYHDDDGMLVLRARLPPEVGAIVVKALEAALAAGRGEDVPAETPGPASGRDVPAETPPAAAGGEAPAARLVAPGPVCCSPREDLADALGVVARAALGHGLAAGAAGAGRQPSPYRVLLHVDEAVLRDPRAPGRCELAGGIGVSAETARRIACDAEVMRVVDLPPGQAPTCAPARGAGTGTGETARPCPLYLGRATRRPSGPLRRALLLRDRGCRFPGCNNRLFLHAHHVRHWADGGTTDLQNTLHLCSSHHRMVHEGGFSVKLTGDRPVFFTAQGALVPATPPAPRLPGDPVASLQAEHRERGLAITPHTGLQTWDGRTVDYCAAVDWLLRVEPRPLSPL